NDKVFLANTFFHEAAHAIFFYLKCVSGGAVNLGVSRKTDKHAAERKVSGDDVVNYFKNSPVHAYLRQDPLYKDYYDARGNIRPEYLNLAVSEAFAYTLEAVLSLSGYNAIRAPVSWEDVEFLVAKGFLPDLFFPEGFLEKYDMPKQTVLSQEFYYALSGYLYAAGRKEEAFALFDRISVRLPQKAAGYLIFLAKNEGNSVFQTFLERALDKGYLRAKESAAIFLGLPEALLNIYILSLRSANEESAERVWSLFLREASKTPPALIGMISAELPYEVNGRILSAFIVLSDENQRADAQSGLFREHFADNDGSRFLIIKAIREKSPEPLRLLTNNGSGAAGGKSAAIFRSYFTNDGGAAAAEAGYARIEDKGMPFEEARLYKGLAVERDYRKQAVIAGTLGIVIAPFSEDVYRLLHPLYVAYDMAVKRQINPSSRRTNGIYYGAGVDVSNFLLSTNAAHGDFIAYYNSALTVQELENIRHYDMNGRSEDQSEKQNDYLKWKSRLGFGAGKRLEKKEDIAANLALELKMLGVDLSRVSAGKDSRDCPEIRFYWAYPGEMEREYRVSFIDKSEVENTEVLYGTYDVYYQKAGMEIPYGYRSFPGRPSFLLKIYEHMVPGSWFITDDYAQKVKIADLSSEFPLPFPTVPVEVNRMVRDSILEIHKESSSLYISDPVAWSYGWDMRMRRVPENKPFLNMDGGKNTDLAGTQPWTGRITDVTGNKFLRNNPYFLALAAKSVPQLPNSGLLGIGGENYNKLRRNSNPLYLMTKDIDHRRDLPAGYATVSGLRKPRITTRHLPSHLSEVPRVELFLPDKDIFLTSNAYNGSQGCVKLGVLATGEPVALKAYFSGDISVKESMDRLLESYRVGQIADDLGIGPCMHGLFEDDIGTLWMVMDIVPGDFPPGAGEFIKAWSIEEFIEINERLEKAGWITDDFQYYITPNGHVVVIDTYFMAEDILPGIELFSSELAGFLKYAGDDVREQFAGLTRGAVIKDKDGGDADLSIVPATSGINEPAGHLLNQDAKGGIDFRSLPVTAQNADVSVKMILPSRPAAVIPEAELVKEWNVIRDLISSGNIPAAKKIRDYWISAGGNGSGEKERVLRCVMEIMRMEEECAVPCEQGLLELLGALESGV
ncbi:MAG: hypothetical protein WC418_04700, partial [Candidatus Omnitrophota bacterium]